MPLLTYPKLVTTYQPKGDQPKAIDELVAGFQQGVSAQTLLGVTGSGKTFTMANVIERLRQPTLIISHNKTLAAQLFSEFKQFFPHNAVEYFVSYYDFYQPEAYLPATSTYIEKKILINEEIEKLRLRTVSSLLSGRKDVVVISSVACIYGMSDPSSFGKNVLHLNKGERLSLDRFLLSLVKLLYARETHDLKPGKFRVQGDRVDLFLAYQDYIYRFYFFGEQLEMIQQVDPLTDKSMGNLSQVTIYPANLFVTSQELIEQVRPQIEKDVQRQVQFLQSMHKMEEAKRLEERTLLDIEMMQELGYCPGIENYSRYFDGRKPGQRPYCLLDYFPKESLLIIDESHVTLPQVRAMYGGDRARKTHLVEYGFRLPAAIDNRPLNFEEFTSLQPKTLYVSATPGDYEIKASEGVIIEQVIRPTGLLDPTISVHPTDHQIDHLLSAIHERIIRHERVLITTLTKKMAEKLSQYLAEAQIKARYMHSDVKTLDRIALLDALRAKEFDVLVGVNLLREGLDLPQVSLVAILDADKEGFLRNTRSLIQIIGRAARHVCGHVLMYADTITSSIKAALEATQQRRIQQKAYNKAHHIVPTSVKSATHTLLKEKELMGKIAQYHPNKEAKMTSLTEKEKEYQQLSLAVLMQRMKKKERVMKKCADAMDYKQAKVLRDEMLLMKQIVIQRKHSQSKLS